MGMSSVGGLVSNKLLIKVGALGIFSTAVGVVRLGWTEINETWFWLLVACAIKDWVKIVASDHGKLDPSILLGYQAAVEDNLDQRPSHHDMEEDHDHDDEINSTHIIFNRSFDPEKLQDTLQKLAKKQEIYRIKGFVAVPNKPMRLVMQGVGTRFDRFYDRPWKPKEEKQTRLVFIGRDLQSSRIESELAAL